MYSLLMEKIDTTKFESDGIKINSEEAKRKSETLFTDTGFKLSWH